MTSKPSDDLTPPFTGGKPHSILEGYLWPDPDPSEEAPLRVDNVARMSATRVDRIVFPKNEREVCRILQQTIRQDQRITVRGTQHCMGGQAIPSNSDETFTSIVMDTRYLAHMKFDAHQNHVTVGPGCRWADVVRFLNQHGKAPKTMQSYASFSIGGTLSVNAHGITTDTALVEDIVSLRLVHYDQHQGEVRTTTLSPTDELFSFVVGGYGLFGIVIEVTLMVTDNYPLVMDSINAKVVSDEPGKEKSPSEFERIWKASKEPNNKVQVKLARLNILTLETALVYLFRKTSNLPVLAPLPLEPREMSATSKLLYKWALPLMTSVRMSQEESTGAAMDMATDGVLSQNQLLYESALPLAKLYSPFAVMESTTFVLQEFFCPSAKFQEWIEKARPIYNTMHEQKIGLLNTTIRYVEKDEKSFLRYATEDMFSFVLYFRINKQQDKLLGNFHNELAQMTVGMGGTFYLPYRHYYSSALMQQAYPQLQEFCRRKQTCDPRGIFWSSFFEDYLLQHCSIGFPCKQPQTVTVLGLIDDANAPPTLKSFLASLPQRSESRHSNHINQARTCYDTLVRDRQLRQEFLEAFLVNVFSVEEPNAVMRAIVKATWDPKAEGMLGIYQQIYDTFNASERGISLQAQKMWRSLRQLSAQKTELTRETCSILDRAGFFGKLRSYVSVGDHGKLVLNLHKAGAFSNDADPLVYVVHNFDEDCESDPPSILERGSLNPVGHHIQYDYRADSASEKLAALPSDSIDLVTINQGLHHIPPNEQLFGFLAEVLRILAPGGLFIVREHDLMDDEQPEDRSNNDHRFQARIEMLDLAHSIFNAVTGVTPLAEQKEIRAFRPVDEWKSIVCSFGLNDTMLMEVQQGDPTCDMMLCFQKPGEPLLRAPMPNAYGPLRIEEPPVAATFRALLSQVPSSAVTSARSLAAWLVSVSEKLDYLLKEQVKSAVEDKEVAKIIDSLIRRLESIVVTLRGGQELLQNVNIRDTVDLVGLLSMPEIFLVLPCLKRLVDKSDESEMQDERKLLRFVEEYLPSLLLAEAKVSPNRPRSQVNDKGHSSTPSLTEDITATLKSLGRSIPGLADPAWLTSSGFTLAQQSTLLAAFGGMSDVDSFSLRLADYCDRDAWEELKAALVGPATPSVQSCGQLPTKELLLSKEQNHPWRRALKAFLKSSKVQLTSQTLRGMRWLGLPELADLYQACKREAGSSVAISRSLSTKMQTSEIVTMQKLASNTVSKAIKKVRFRFDMEKQFELHDVGQIVSAHFGYKSLTSSLSDITAELSHFHSRVCQVVRQQDNKTGYYHSIGWLPLQIDELNKMRSSTVGLRAADSVRQKVVGLGSLGMAGGTQLELSYIPLYQKPKADALGSQISSAHALCDLLKERDVIRGNMHNNDGHFTWFKLCEWMLVDILEKFGTSLDHTPWYFFPYVDCIKLYFQVLLREANIVCAQYGPMKAYASQAFLTDIVPGVVMGLIFGQLHVMSAPLAALFPMQNEEIMVEELVLQLPCSIALPGKPLVETLRSCVDQRIRGAELLSSNISDFKTGLFKITVPTYKAMGEILVGLAMAIPTARVLQISGQELVQVRVVAQLKYKEGTAAQREISRIKDHLQQLEGVDVLFHYQFPCDDEALRQQGTLLDEKLHIALRVSVLSLISLIQAVNRMREVTVDQIYEIWNGW